MDVMRCRANKRLLSALALVEVKTGSILKIWYEDDWDAFATKDMIVDEVKAFRVHPRAYIEAQIGIR